MTKQEELIKSIISEIGDDPSREGLIDTPARVVRSWRELYSGYGQKPEDVLGTIFDAEKYDQMVILRNIELYSTCEHHMIPFYGSCDIGYLPGKKVVGLSKLARLVEVFSRRLQIQERLTQEIARAIDDSLKPRGSMVVVRAKHMCMCARGIGKQDSWMVTSAIRGVFYEREVREEFLQLTRE